MRAGARGAGLPSPFLPLAPSFPIQKGPRLRPLLGGRGGLAGGGWQRARGFACLIRAFGGWEGCPVRVGSQEGVKNDTLGKWRACKGALPLATVRLGPRDCDGCFQPPSRPGLPIPGSWLGYRPSLQPPPLSILQPWEKNLLTQILATGLSIKRNHKGAPCSCGRANTCCRKALCIRLHDKSV